MTPEVFLAVLLKWSLIARPCTLFYLVASYLFCMFVSSLLDENALDDHGAITFYQPELPHKLRAIYTTTSIEVKLLNFAFDCMGYIYGLLSLSNSSNNLLAHQTACATYLYSFKNSYIYYYC